MTQIRGLIWSDEINSVRDKKLKSVQRHYSWLLHYCWFSRVRRMWRCHPVARIELNNVDLWNRFPYRTIGGNIVTVRTNRSREKLNREKREGTRFEIHWHISHRNFHVYCDSSSVHIKFTTLDSHAVALEFAWKTEIRKLVNIHS